MFKRIVLPAVLLGVSALAQAGQLDDIRQNKQLRVCVWPDYYGISWRDPRSLQLTGVDVDMAKSLAASLSVPVRFVDSSFATLIADVTENRCDIAMFAIGMTPARQEKLAFTTPHLVSDIYAITTKSNRRIQGWADIDQPGVVVAVAKGTLHEPVMRERLRKATLLVTDTPQGREQEVIAGRADVFMTDYPFSRRMLETKDWARLISPPTKYHLTPYAWAMRQGDEAWLNYVNRFVENSRKDGSLKQAIDRHKLSPIATGS